MLVSVVVKRYWTRSHGTSTFSNKNAHLDQILIKDYCVNNQDVCSEKPGVGFYSNSWNKYGIKHIFPK